MSADPDFFITKKLAKTAKGLRFFGKEALEEYKRCFRNPATVHAMCEDYRATATRRSRDGHRGFRRRQEDRLSGADPVGRDRVGRPAPAGPPRSGRSTRPTSRRQGAAVRALSFGGGAGGDLRRAARVFQRRQIVALVIPRSARPGANPAIQWPLTRSTSCPGFRVSTRCASAHGMHIDWRRALGAAELLRRDRVRQAKAAPSTCRAGRAGRDAGSRSRCRPRTTPSRRDRGTPWSTRAAARRRRAPRRDQTK